MGGRCSLSPLSPLRVSGEAYAPTHRGDSVTVCGGIGVAAKRAPTVIANGLDESCQQGSVEPGDQPGDQRLELASLSRREDQGQKTVDTHNDDKADYETDGGGETQVKAYLL